jgi:hypothetical protein
MLKAVAPFCMMEFCAKPSLKPRIDTRFRQTQTVMPC